MSETDNIEESQLLDDDEHHTESIWTVANVVSFSRVLAVVPLVWLSVAGRHLWMTAILAYIGVSDYLDGVIARHLKHVSKLGKVLDPICDRIALGAAMIVLFVTGYLPPVLGYALLLREILVSGGVIVLGALGWPPLIKPTMSGKAATLMLMFGIPMFVIADSGLSTAGASRILAWGFSIPGALLYYVAALQYGKKAYDLRHMRRSKAMRMLEEPE
ncbi:MAG: hypothetical protein DCC49_10125 [Acidobacteria bacterium]|nr:MAG: hypothetical protein DCC49_10125 [Acidobacteriota bacterium]